VEAVRAEDGSYQQVRLKGPVQEVYTGTITG
jgi:hypothetical protein